MEGSARSKIKLGDIRFTGNYQRDVATATKYWRDSAVQLSRLPKKSLARQSRIRRRKIVWTVAATPANNFSCTTPT